MVKPIVVSKASYTQVSPGLHAAGLSEVVDRGTQDLGYGAKHYLIARFMVDQPDPQSGEPLIVEMLVTASLSSKSRLTEIVTALLNGAPVPAQLDLNELVGRRCQLLITQKPGKDGRLYSRVQSIMPPAQSQVQTAPPSVSAPAAVPF